MEKSPCISDVLTSGGRDDQHQTINSQLPQRCSLRRRSSSQRDSNPANTVARNRSGSCPARARAERAASSKFGEVAQVRDQLQADAFNAKRERGEAGHPLQAVVYAVEQCWSLAARSTWRN
jgi:hypothetical protein